MAISLVQKTTFTGITSGGTKQITSVAAGNLLVLTIGTTGFSFSGIAVSDSAGGTWAQANLQNNNPGFQICCTAVWHLLPAAVVAGTHTLTVTFTGGGTVQVGILEYKNVLGFDKGSGNNTNNGTAGAASIVTALPNELIVGIGARGGGGATMTASPAGFVNETGGTSAVQTMDGVVTTATTYIPTLTAGTGSNWAFSCAAYTPKLGVPNSLMLVGCGT